MKNRYLFVVIMFVIMMVTSCTQKSLGPENVLKKYIELRLEKNVNKDELLKYTTGKVAEDVKNLQPNEVLTLGKLQINNVKCEETKCTIGYIIQIIGEKEVSDVKKVATLIKENNEWKISEVDNVKTYHDMKEPINPLQ